MSVKPSLRRSISTRQNLISPLTLSLTKAVKIGHCGRFDIFKPMQVFARSSLFSDNPLRPVGAGDEFYMAQREYH